LRLESRLEKTAFDFCITTAAIAGESLLKRPTQAALRKRERICGNQETRQESPAIGAIQRMSLFSVEAYQ